MATKILTLLRRVSDNKTMPNLVNLSDEIEVKIGRSPDVKVCILSNMISRCHAILRKQNDGLWTLADNKSLNGVYLNCERLLPSQSILLKDGDLIQLGMVKGQESISSEFVYKFCAAEKVKVIKRRRSDNKDLPELHKKHRSALPGELRTSDNRVSSSQGDFPDHAIVCDNTGDSVLTCSPNKSISTQKSSPFTEYKLKIEEKEREAEVKIKEFEQQVQDMQRLLNEKEAEEERMKVQLQQEQDKAHEQEEQLSKFRESEQELKETLQRKQQEFETEKLELEEQMRQALEQQLNERENELRDQLQTQHNALVDEKQMVEERLHAELTSALEEKDKKLEEELIAERDKLQRVIEKKELEQKLLESQLKDTISENAQQKEAMLCAKEEMLTNFADLMETELQCSICNELFIQATSLNCSHAYCSLCIAQWRQIKQDCPVCRAPISSHIRSIVLDSYIDKMVEQLSAELKERRIEIVAKRKEDQKIFDDKNEPQSSKSQGVQAASVVHNPDNGTGPRRSERRRHARPANQPGDQAQAGTTEPGTAAAAAGNVIIPEVAAHVVVSSDSEEEDNEDDSLDGMRSDRDSMMSNDSEDSIEGNDAYFGGYGRCYSCGRRGHWANGCPFR